MTKFEKIIELLKEDSFFDDYTFRKRDSSFVHKFEGGERRIEFSKWTDFIAISVEPQFFVRFDFVHKWFEKFSFKTLRDQRDAYTVGGWTRKYGCYPVYNFKHDGNNFLEEFNKLKETIKICAGQFFNEYRTPEDVYVRDILPILEGRAELPGSGANWLFWYLTICKVVAPENYDRLKAMSIEQAKVLVSRKYPEPNMERYYDRLDEILGYLDSLSVDDLMKKRLK